LYSVSFRWLTLGHKTALQVPKIPIRLCLLDGRGGRHLPCRRCFRWRCAPVFGIIITNFTALSNNTFNLFTIYLSILQYTNYSCDTTLSHAQLFLRGDRSERMPFVGQILSRFAESIFSLNNHIAIVFPPPPPFSYSRLFRRPSAASNSVNPGSFSKWRPAKDVKY